MVIRSIDRLGLDFRSFGRSIGRWRLKGFWEDDQSEGRHTETWEMQLIENKGHGLNWIDS